jgi:hypothetical protein
MRLGRRGLLVPILALFPTGCVPTVRLDNAACPCTDGYYCTDGGACASEATLASGLVGNSYILRISREQWTRPPMLAEVVHNDTGMDYPVFAFRVLQANPATRTFSTLVGTMRDGLQDMRNKTHVVGGTIAGGGDGTLSFELGPMDIQTILFGPESNTLANYYGFTLTGRFTAQGQYADHGTFDTVMKASEIYNLFFLVPITSGDELCRLFSQYARYDCTACPAEPSTPLCLPFQALDFSIAIAPDLVLREVADFDGESI